MNIFRHMLISATCSLVLAACSGATTGGARQDADTVRVEREQLADTTSFVKSNGERCTITAAATIEYPALFGDRATTERLQRLFAAFVLNAPDSISITDAMKAAVSNSLHQYDFGRQWPDADEADGDGAPAVFKYNTNTNVALHYNRNGIATFCKTEVVKKNDRVTSVTHRYYNFDLKTMTYVDLRQMFREEAIADVTAMLRGQLMQQNKAASDEQLNDMGFFNVDNITAGRNFYFDDKGVTWSYLPGQLAVDAVGEPQITLTYDRLADVACEGSILSRLD